MCVPILTATNEPLPIKKCTVAVGILFLSCLLGWQPAAGKPCASPDNVKSVSSSEHCLQIRTYTPRQGPGKTLLVALHGDLSRGGSADYIASVARISATYDAVGVAMARPGYTVDGRTSSGVATRDQARFYRYGSEEIDSNTAAVAALKKHHGANRLVMVGHSGGAVISGVMLGRAAPLVDVAVLVSCPCDVARWRHIKDCGPLPTAESPIDYLSKVPKSAKIYAVTGERDKNTWPALAEDYVDKAKGMGLDATFLPVKKAGHGFRRIDRSDVFDEALWQAIKSP